MSLSEREIVSRLKDNVARVRERMVAAAGRVRTDQPTRLIPVTKYVEADVASLLVTECGFTELAESRPQELWRKEDGLAHLWPERFFAWHLIGHLQRNKVRRTLPMVACVQSVDSLTLLEEISREAGLQKHPMTVLLEVNVSGESSKHGLRAEELGAVLERAAELPHLFVMGLMTMAALEGGPDKTRRDFANLRSLRDSWRLTYAPNVILAELSMGMSGDYEIAIEEGATMVRVGSALFEGIV